MTVSIVIDRGYTKEILYNVCGNRLVFEDKAHAEYWAHQKGFKKFELIDNSYMFDDDLGRSTNVWEYEDEIPDWFYNVMVKCCGADPIEPKQMTIFDLIGA